MSANAPFLARGEGIDSVTRSSAGTYVVDVNRNVSGCVWMANVGAAGTAAAPNEGQGMTYVTLGSANDRLNVYTFDKGGSVANRPFHLQVLC